ncbi:Uncharacterised protein [Vibrio cholerae]|nr:Uncharacterised protein [Vibrio cholerae]
MKTGVVQLWVERRRHESHIFICHIHIFIIFVEIVAH